MNLVALTFLHCSYTKMELLRDFFFLTDYNCRFSGNQMLEPEELISVADMNLKFLIANLAEFLASPV